VVRCGMRGPHDPRGKGGGRKSGRLHPQRPLQLLVCRLHYVLPATVGRKNGKTPPPPCLCSLFTLNIKKGSVWFTINPSKFHSHFFPVYARVLGFCENHCGRNHLT